jgi:hypothetical protein
MTGSDPNTQFENIVRAAAPGAFGAGFTDRVMQRVDRERELRLSDVLEKQLRRIVPIAAAAALLLAGYNWWGTRDSGRSALERALNLPQVTIASAFNVGSESQ